MREFRFWLRERKKKRRVFACPVCHLELSMDDLDKDGYTVCPLCSVVLEVVNSGGFPIPVVHNVELKRAQPKLRLHTMLTHVSIGLMPLGLLFGILSLVLSFVGIFSIQTTMYMEKLGFTLFSISLAGSVVTFLTGFYDWRTRFRARQYKIITEKIKYSILLWILGSGALILRLGISGTDSILSMQFGAFLILQALMVAVIGVIGHIGGNLVFGK